MVGFEEDVLYISWEGLFCLGELIVFKVKDKWCVDEKGVGGYVVDGVEDNVFFFVDMWECVVFCCVFVWWIWLVCKWK